MTSPPCHDGGTGALLYFPRERHWRVACPCGARRGALQVGPPPYPRLAMKIKRPRLSTARRPARGDVTAARQFFARFVTTTVGVHNQRIVNAFATVAREDFVGPGPWHIWAGDGYIVTESDDPVVLYQNILVDLAPERSINNGQPTLHAKAPATTRRSLRSSSDPGVRSMLTRLSKTWQRVPQ